MHDFFLAKEIINTLQKIGEEKKLSRIRKVFLEIGNITHGDHIEDIDLDNLRFLLKSVTHKYGLDKAKYEITRVAGSSWKITDLEVK